MSNGTFSGKIEVQNSTTPEVVITLDADTGDLIIRDATGHERIRIGRIQEFTSSSSGKPGVPGVQPKHLRAIHSRL
jgi:hypothetical protein